MEVWQGLVTKFWPSGEIAWQRVDTDQERDDVSPSGPANAVEYVTQNKDGTFLVTHDDTNGMGFRVLGKDPAPPCGSYPAWKACSDANKLDCSSGSTTCGACKTGFKASGGNCVDVCDASAKATCTSANKLGCSSGSTICGACKTGFKASGGNCVDVCDASAKAACTSANKLGC